ncbi:hypothetical protein D3C71_1952680 [compost metagenome]
MEVKAFEKLLEIRHADPGQQHALELAVPIVHAPRQRNDPLTVLPTANRRPDMGLQRRVLLMEPEVVTIRHPLAPR